MDIRLIRSKKEYESLYDKSGKYRPEDYPSKYPCIVRVTSEDTQGSPGGDYTYYIREVLYFPENLKVADRDTYFSGVKATENWRMI